MWALFETSYAGAKRDAFQRDLAEKHHLIVLKDANGELQGFSTLLKLEVEGACVVFSGDTGPAPELVPLARDADLLIHEATYSEQDRDLALCGAQTHIAQDVRAAVVLVDAFDFQHSRLPPGRPKGAMHPLGGQRTK